MAGTPRADQAGTRHREGRLALEAHLQPEDEPLAEVQVQSSDSCTAGSQAAMGNDRADVGEGRKAGGQEPDALGLGRRL
eukprot:1704790-Alexandrium_andersonii.AAC.1